MKVQVLRRSGLELLPPTEKTSQAIQRIRLLAAVRKAQLAAMAHAQALYVLDGMKPGRGYAEAASGLLEDAARLDPAGFARLEVSDG